MNIKRLSAFYWQHEHGQRYFNLCKKVNLCERYRHNFNLTGITYESLIRFQCILYQSNENKETYFSNLTSNFGLEIGNDEQLKRNADPFIADSITLEPLIRFWWILYQMWSISSHLFHNCAADNNNEFKKALSKMWNINKKLKCET